MHDNTPQQFESLASRRNDELLEESINIRSAFCESAMTWLTNAELMLRNGEWAEQHPRFQQLADMEIQVSELVALAHRYEEIQSKFRAACYTLESMQMHYVGGDKWVKDPNWVNFEDGDNQ